MSLSVINWNILYATKRPSDEERFDASGKPTEAEIKAGTAALAFFCYNDKTSSSTEGDIVLPEKRQEVKQPIRGTVYTYYRGGSNAEVRMEEVKQNIAYLARKADVICLQEVTTAMAGDLTKIFKDTHGVFYSYQRGNNHGVMVLVNNKFAVKTDGEVSLQGDGGVSRLVRYVDVQSPTDERVIRVAAAHLYGHKGREVSPHKEAEGLFDQLAKQGRCDTIVLAADANVPKKFRQPPSTKIHYAEATEAAGWQLQLTKPPSGRLPIEPKPAVFGLCAIMQNQANPSQPIDLSDLPPALSDHAPIGTTITISKPVAAAAPVSPPAPKPAAAARPVPTSPGGFFGFLSKIWAAVFGFFKRFFSR